MWITRRHSQQEERINHLGVEVFEDGDVDAAAARFRAAGIDHEIEPEKHCCHATQNKVWAREPQGLRWEWYRILEDTDALFPASGSLPEERQADGHSPTAEPARPVA